MKEISVILCTHNPREDYLRRTLEALKLQTMPRAQWELLLVDNASAEALAESWDLSWHPHARHAREEKIGLTHARLCGIAAAQGELLVFVDDDNVLRADYLQGAQKISADFPWLGAWSGSCVPEFEIEPPAELRPWLAGLLIEKLTEPVWAKLRQYTVACPAGAGMVVRRRQALHYRELVLHDPLRQALGHSGNQLSAGEDGDLALCGFELGLGTGRFPALELTHLISARRINLNYLKGIHEGFGYAGVMMKALHQPGLSPRPPRLASVRLALKKLLWWAGRKDRIERSIRLAEDKGQLRAFEELKQRSRPH